MADLKRVGLVFLTDHLALEHLEGLVGELRTNGTTHVPVLLALVEVEHTDDATILTLRQSHQLFHDACCLNSIVDVGHKVLDAVDDADVGFNGTNCHINHLTSFLVAKSPQIKSKERIVYVAAFAT